MDLNKLCELRDDKIFTDLILTLDDGSDQIILHLHKIVLCASSIYFRTLLTSFKEKNLTEITVRVPNVYASNDIIMGFYGEKTNAGNFSDWRHLIETVKCREFFNMKVDLESLESIQVPAIGFELLLEAVEPYLSDKNIMKMIIKNLPPDYNLNMLSKELITEMIDMIDWYYIICETDEGTKCINSKIFEYICCPFLHDNTKIVSYSSEKNQIVYTYGRGTIRAYDFNNQCMFSLLIFNQYDGINCMCQSPTDDTMAIVFYDTNRDQNDGVYIHDIKNNKKIYKLSRDIYDNICYSPNGKYLAGYCLDIISIWNTETGTSLYKIQCEDDVDLICFFADNKKLIHNGTHFGIDILDIDTGDFTHIQHYDSKIISLCYLSKPNLSCYQIVCGYKNSVVIICDNDGKIVQKLDNHYITYLSCFDDRYLFLLESIREKNKTFEYKSKHRYDQCIIKWDILTNQNNTYKIRESNDGYRSYVNKFCLVPYNRKLLNKLKEHL